MTPQEKELITHLLDRLRAAGNRPKDREAEALIGQAVRAQPDAPYLLVQTVLIQDMALSAGQARIAELERQLAETQQAALTAPAPSSFLGAAGHGSVPVTGPWGRPAAAPSAPASAPPTWSQSGGGAGGPLAGGWAGSGWAQPAASPMMAMGGGGGFLRSAAATAAGIAGGALLFQGIELMFGAHAGPVLGGMPMQPGISETVINNYYGNDPAAAAAPWSAPDPGLTSADRSFNDASGTGSVADNAGFLPDSPDQQADQNIADSDLGTGDDIASDFGSGDDSSLV